MSSSPSCSCSAAGTSEMKRSMVRALRASSCTAGGASSGASANSSSSSRTIARSAGVRGDQPRLVFDPARVAVVLGARHPPAAPVGGVGHHHRIGAGIGMVGAVVAASATCCAPASAASRARRCESSPPIGSSGRSSWAWNGRPEADVVGDAHRLLEALGPDRVDLLDHRPGADALDPDLLVSLKDRLRHGARPSDQPEQTPLKPEIIDAQSIFRPPQSRLWWISTKPGGRAR